MKNIFLYLFFLVCFTLFASNDLEVDLLFRNPIKKRPKTQFISLYKSGKMTDESFEKSYEELVQTLIYNDTLADLNPIILSIVKNEKNVYKEYLRLNIFAVERMCFYNNFHGARATLETVKKYLDKKNKASIYEQDEFFQIYKFYVKNNTHFNEAKEALKKMYKEELSTDAKEWLTYLLTNFELESGNLKNAMELISLSKKAFIMQTNERFAMMVLYQEAAINIFTGNLDKSIQQYEEIIAVSQKNRYADLIGKAHLQLGIIYRRNKNYEQAILHNIAALKSFFQYRNLYGIIRIYNNLANLQATYKDYEGAGKTYYKAMKISELADETSMLSRIYHGIAHANFKEKKYAKAELYFQRSLKHNVTKDKNLNVMGLYYLSEIGILQQKYDKARSFLAEYENSSFQSEKLFSHFYNIIKAKYDYIQKPNKKNEKRLNIIADNFKKDTNFSDANLIYDLIRKKYLDKQQFEQAFDYQNMINENYEEQYDELLKNAKLRRLLLKEFTSLYQSLEELRVRNKVHFQDEFNAIKKENIYSIIFLLSCIIVLALIVGQVRKLDAISKKLKKDNAEIKEINLQLDAKNKEHEITKKDLKEKSELLKIQQEEKIKLQQSMTIRKAVKVKHQAISEHIEEIEKNLRKLDIQLDKNEKLVKYRKRVKNEKDKMEEKIERFLQLNDPTFTAYTEETEMLDIYEKKSEEKE